MRMKIVSRARLLIATVLKVAGIFSIESARARIALACASATIISLGAPIGAHAQHVVAQNAATADPALEEIIVTATKRSTSLQDTPISITAVTGQDLLDSGITTVDGLAYETPGVSVNNDGPGQNEYEMRGISSIGGYTATVGFYLDGVPMTAPGFSFLGKIVIDPNLYDVNRIEVARGPQGTLFGGGSMGGNISLFTNQPDSSGFHESAQTILSGTDGGGFNHGENAMVNIPLIDNQLAIRAVVSQASTSGWIDRIVVNPFPAPTDGGATRGNVLAAPVQADYKDVNSEDLYGGRISVLYTPTDLPGLTVGATVFYQRLETGGQQFIDSKPGTLAHYEPFNVPEPYDDSFNMWALNANYKFDGFDVTSVTSHWNRTSTFTEDSSEVTNFYFFGAPSVYPANGGFGADSFTENDDSQQFTQELRVASSGDGRFQWLGGLYYSDFSSTQNFYSFANGFIPSYGTNDLFTQFEPQTLNQKAAFGELSYKILDGLKATVGGRYFKYNSSVDISVSGIISPTGGANHVLIDTSGKADGFNPKFNLSYDINKDLMVYATAERGFRPGGGNQPVPSNGPLGTECLANLKADGLNGVPLSFNPDSLWSYELGEKFKAGTAFTLDGAIYHERWTGVQNTVGLPCGFAFITNSGTAAVNGGELEMKALLGSQWQVAGNFGYTKAYFTQTDALANIVEGQDMANIARMTASGALTRFFAVNADWKGSLRGSYDWTDGMEEPAYLLGLPGLVPGGRLPAHGFAGLRATLFNDHWTAAAFCNNLTNKHTVLAVGDIVSSNIPSYYRAVSNQPLTAGIDINVKF
jgi:iron complex outermembrane recepter protein